jgi:hypothetical protein
MRKMKRVTPTRTDLAPPSASAGFVSRAKIHDRVLFRLNNLVYSENKCSCEEQIQNFTGERQAQFIFYISARGEGAWLIVTGSKADRGLICRPPLAVRAGVVCFEEDLRR